MHSMLAATMPGLHGCSRYRAACSTFPAVAFRLCLHPAVHCSCLACLQLQPSQRTVAWAHSPSLLLTLACLQRGRRHMTARHIRTAACSSMICTSIGKRLIVHNRLLVQIVRQHASPGSQVRCLERWFCGGVACQHQAWSRWRSGWMHP